jgi:hypothetical protein
MSLLTASGNLVKAELFGGRRDGLAVFVISKDGVLPKTHQCEAGEYFFDGYTRNNEPRYSLKHLLVLQKTGGAA